MLNYNKTKSQSSTIEDKVKEKDLLQKELEGFLIKYKQEVSSNLISDLFDLRSKVETFYKLKSKFVKTEEDINDLEKEINLIKNEINSFFKIFNFDKELSNEEKINVLKGCLNNLERDKNLIISSSILSELNKVEALVNNVELKKKYENWQERFEAIRDEEIPKITDEIIELQDDFNERDYNKLKKGGLSPHNYKSSLISLPVNSICLYITPQASSNFLEAIKESF